MKIRTSTAASVLVMVAIAAPAHADVLIANEVAQGVKQTLLTVATGRKFKLSSAVISSATCDSGFASTAYRLRILNSNTPVTSYLSLGPGGSTQVTFSPELVFTAGQAVAVQNLDNSGFNCPASFMLQGTTCRTSVAGC